MESNGPMTTFPQIVEQGAPPHIAAIYREIREVSGIPVVNLIWRHLAALPDILPWAWTATAPVVGSASMDTARELLASSIILPHLPAPGALAWRDAGVTGLDLRQLIALNEAYIRGNLTNILALTGLRLRLEYPDRPATRLQAASAAVHAAWTLDPLPRIDDLEDGLATRIRTLAARHDAAGVIPSLYLALAPWPGVIDALPDWLSPLYDPAALRSARASICAVAEGEALLPANGPPPDGAAAMRDILQLFTRVVIPDLIAIGFALRRVLPSPPDPH